MQDALASDSSVLILGVGKRPSSDNVVGDDQATQAGVVDRP
jgi:hypothetical protein